ncbi:MAG: molybdopterin-dependent oxidoreductase [Chloroflexota bacterium]
MQSSIIKPFLCLTLLLFGLVGCLAASTEQPFEDAYTVVTEASISADDVLPRPTGDVILVVSGQIGKSNSAENSETKLVEFDRELVESLGLSEFTILDPFEEREVTYRGVLVRDLLNGLQVDASATDMLATALNDYAITIPLEQFHEYPVLMALQSDGEYMTPDYRGPLMFVYPMHQYDFGKLDIPYRDNWIWQIKSIEIQ